MVEKQSGGIERGRESVRADARERLDELSKRHEKVEIYNEGEARQSAEKARIEAKNEALFSKEYSTESKHAHIDTEEPVKVVTKQQKEHAYKQTMNHIQTEMSPLGRGFSKIIHNTLIEKTSDTVGSTIARPNSILLGSVFAFLGVLAVYLYAKHTGFALTGFETIAAFIAGWLLGLLVDFVRVLAGKR